LTPQQTLNNNSSKTQYPLSTKQVTHCIYRNRNRTNTTNTNTNNLFILTPPLPKFVSSQWFRGSEAHLSIAFGGRGQGGVIWPDSNWLQYPSGVPFMRINDGGGDSCWA